MIIVKFLTVNSFAAISEDSGAKIEAVATAYEANPIFRFVFLGRMFVTVMIAVVMPGLAMATYYYFRKKVDQGRMEADSLEFFVLFAFFTLLVNMTNDSAIYLAKVM